MRIPAKLLYRHNWQKIAKMQKTQNHRRPIITPYYNARTEEFTPSPVGLLYLILYSTLQEIFQNQHKRSLSITEILKNDAVRWQFGTGALVKNL